MASECAAFMKQVALRLADKKKDDYTAVVFDQKLQFLGPPWVRTLVEVRTARRYSHDHSITSEVLSLVCPSLRV